MNVPITPGDFMSEIKYVVETNEKDCDGNCLLVNVTEEIESDVIETLEMLGEIKYDLMHDADRQTIVEKALSNLDMYECDMIEWVSSGCLPSANVFSDKRFKFIDYND